MLTALLLGFSTLAAVPQPARPDSVALLRRAVSAQAEFERIRRRHLPWTEYRSGNPCDERIGRFCLWHHDEDEDDEDWTPPQEPAAVVRARDGLLATLAATAARLPGDHWVAGQRVRYLVDAERTDEARQAARACRAEGWWCLALLGFASHAARDYAAADSAFDAALAVMPAARRRAWTDLRVLLEGPDERAYRRLADAQRTAAERRFWWLADPLWMQPGNDRRSEHFARHVLDLLQPRTKSVENLAWGWDLRELLLRYGWPVGWERMRPNHPLQPEPPGIVTQYAPNARVFLPAFTFLAEPARIEPAAWPLKVKRARTEYAPVYARRFVELQHQLAVFRRGDSALVVAAYRTPLDTLPDDSTAAEAALLVAGDETGELHVARDSVRAERGALQVRVPPRPAVVSVEVLATPARAARARYGVQLAPLAPGRAAVSDVLLFDALGPLPNSLEEALPFARPGGCLRPGERVGIYWEAYGLQPDTAGLPVAVSLRRGTGGWARRTAERLGLLGVDEPVQLRWRDAPPGAADAFARAVLLTIPERLDAGDYLLELEVSPAGHDTVRGERRLCVE